MPLNSDHDELPITFWLLLALIMGVLLLLGAGIQEMLRIMDGNNDTSTLASPTIHPPGEIAPADVHSQ